MNTTITAHAGAENTAPNTLEGLAALLSTGADVLELDIRLKDGVPVLSHEALEDGKSYPTLREALTLLSGHGVGINLDLKYEGCFDKTWEELSHFCIRAVFTGSLSAEEAASAHRNGAEIWYNEGNMNEEQKKDLLGSVRGLGFEMLNIDVRKLPESVLEDEPYALSVWTVDDEPTLRKLLLARVKGITTRNPRLALALRRESQGV